jgi:hypothetical protein
MDFSVEFDSFLSNYLLHIAGEMIVLQSTTQSEAQAEGQSIADSWE